jgi:two-component system response regulator PilR (NtrC family)
MRGAARVAVAEDDPDMRRLVADALRRDGHSVVEVEDGARLQIEVAQVSSDAVDLIVSDIRMPLVTGLEILRNLREQRSKIPFVLMTAFGDEATRREAVQLGAIVFSKPFKLDELRGVVRALIEGTRK